MQTTIDNLLGSTVVSAMEGAGNGARLYLTDNDGGTVLVWIETPQAALELISCAQKAEQSLIEYAEEPRE